MLIVDYTNTVVLVIVVMFFITMNIIGFVKKNAWFIMTSVLVNITLFTLHVLLDEALGKEALMFNARIDFIALAINIPLLLVVDEIETRRELIKNVFENKYKK